jgi:hypothetical protein
MQNKKLSTQCIDERNLFLKKMESKAAKVG